MADSATIRVHIPLAIRKRGGRPRILPPKEIEAIVERGQDPHVLRAIGRAWGWRRKLERGEVTTLGRHRRERIPVRPLCQSPDPPRVAVAEGPRTAGPAARAHGADDQGPVRRRRVAVGANSRGGCLGKIEPKPAKRVLYQAGSVPKLNAASDL